MAEKVRAKIEMEPVDGTVTVTALEKLYTHLDKRVPFFDDMEVDPGTVTVLYEAHREEEPYYEGWDWPGIVTGLEAISGMEVDDYAISLKKETV